MKGTQEVCSLDSCSNTFIKNAHNKLYCSQSCTNSAYRSKNKERINRQWREHYASKGYEAHIYRKYGISLEDWNTLSKNGCDMCGSKARLVVDHNHITGRVRGCLCLSHNAGLGSFHDSIEELKQAIRYLEDHSD